MITAPPGSPRGWLLSEHGGFRQSEPRIRAELFASSKMVDARRSLPAALGETST